MTQHTIENRDARQPARIGTRQEFRQDQRLSSRQCRNSWRVPLQITLLLCVVGNIAQSLGAQEVAIVPQRGPYYVGEPMVIQVQINGVQSNQDVDCQLSQSQLPPGVSVEGPQIGQSKSSFSQRDFSGRMISREIVSFTYSFQVTADRPGTNVIGPFIVEIDAKSQDLGGIEVEFEELEDDPEMELELSLPRSTIYVGEQVPVTICWRFAGDREGLQFAFSNLQIRSPLFDQLPFVESQPKTRTTLSIVTAQGVVEVDAKVEQERRNGEDYVVLTGQRTLIPNTPGEYSEISASCRTQRVTRWGRDIFGGARPRDSAPALARAKPLSFRVLPIPTVDRPSSYSGAVGSGFGIEVAANRSVVRVGDPIVLDVTLTGDGDLDRCSLPRLSNSLDENSFQLPNEEPVGLVAGKSKQFKVSVRVKDATVGQLPAIEFSWFDPKQEKFITASSKPIALQVNAAQIVSAADVVSSSSVKSISPNSSEGTSTPKATNQPPTVSALNFVGANLAIEKNLPNLVVAPSSLAIHDWWTPTLYLLGIALMALGLIAQRYRARSPRQTQRQSVIKQTRSRVQRAERQPPRDATNSIASALRQLVAAYPDGDRTAVDAIIAECEQLGFAPAHHDDSSLKSDLVARALAAIDNFFRKQTS